MKQVFRWSVSFILIGALAIGPSDVLSPLAEEVDSIDVTVVKVEEVPNLPLDDLPIDLRSDDYAFSTFLILFDTGNPALQLTKVNLRVHHGTRPTPRKAAWLTRFFAVLTTVAGVHASGWKSLLAATIGAELHGSILRAFQYQKQFTIKGGDLIDLGDGRFVTGALLRSNDISLLEIRSCKIENESTGETTKLKTELVVPLPAASEPAVAADEVQDLLGLGDSMNTFQTPVRGGERGAALSSATLDRLIDRINRGALEAFGLRHLAVRFDTGTGDSCHYHDDGRIYMGSGCVDDIYETGGRAGVKLLIAHELAHALQHQVIGAPGYGDRTTTEIELQADFIAGYILGTAGIDPWSQRGVLDCIHVYGDDDYDSVSHHGPGIMRWLALRSGIRFARGLTDNYTRLLGGVVDSSFTE